MKVCMYSCQTRWIRRSHVALNLFHFDAFEIPKSVEKRLQQVIKGVK